MRILHMEIKNCDSCPFCREIQLECSKDYFLCDKAERRICYGNDWKKLEEGVPDWCPLPKKEEYMKDIEKHSKQSQKNSI